MQGQAEEQALAWKVRDWGARCGCPRLLPFQYKYLHYAEGFHTLGFIIYQGWVLLAPSPVFCGPRVWICAMEYSSKPLSSYPQASLPPRGWPFTLRSSNPENVTTCILNVARIYGFWEWSWVPPLLAVSTALSWFASLQFLTWVSAHLQIPCPGD